MRSAPSLCSAATAHYAPASTLFSSTTPPSTQIQRSAPTPLSFLKPALFPQARSLSSSQRSLRTASSFHLALFLQLHPRRKLNAQLRRPRFSRACSLFSTPRLLHPARFLSPCSLSSSPRSNQIQRSAQTPALFSSLLSFLNPALAAPCALLFSLLSSSNSTLDSSSALSSDARAFLEPALFSHPCAWSVQRSFFHLAIFLNLMLDANLALSSDALYFLKPALFSHHRARFVQRSFFHLALFLQLHPRRKLNAQLRRPHFSQASSLFSPPRSVRLAIFPSTTLLVLTALIAQRTACADSS